MVQGTPAGKPGLPATDDGACDMFSCRSGRTSTTVYMEGEWCAGRSGVPLPNTPTLDDAPIGDVVEHPPGRQL